LWRRCDKKSNTQPAIGNQKTISGKVISIADGDTLTILDNQKVSHKIRLNCIDTPESNQDFGTRAKKELNALVGGKNITVEYTEKDKYGRILGTIENGSQLINLEQVKRGMAWVYRKYCNNCEYFEAEKQARANMLGVWSQPNPVPPWEFRKDPTGAKDKDWTYLYQDTCTAHQTPVSNGHNNDGYSCGTKRYCTQMNSCDEAFFYYETCGVKRLDGDHDGVPCESLCN